MNLGLESRPDQEAEEERYFDPKRRPVDLTHLARYTMGNSVVEREVLQLFRQQARIYFDKLSRATSDDAWRESIRVLKASARSVGAWQLLQTAEDAEQIRNGSVSMRDDMLRALSNHIEEANQFIDSIL